MAEMHLPPFPMPLDKWNAIVEQIDFSPRQREMVELILRNQGVRQIEATLAMRHGTFREQLKRIFRKTQVANQQELIILLCALSHGICPPKG